MVPNGENGGYPVKISVLAVLPALLLSSVLCCLAQDEGMEMVLARVNDQIITRRDAEKLLYMSDNYEHIKHTYHGEELKTMEERLVVNALLILIRDAVIAVNAELDGMELDEVDKKKIEAMYMQAAQGEAYGSEANFEQFLKERGLSPQDIKERLTAMYLGDKYLAQVSRDRFVSPEEAREYYVENKMSFRATVTYRRIVIRFGEGSRSRASALVLAKSIQKDVKEGADFEGMARQYSESADRQEGGLSGTVPIADLRSNIREQVVKLEEGQVSDIIEREDEFMIIKIEEKDEFPYRPFEKVLDDIIGEVNEKKMQEKHEEWDRKLFSRIKIEIFFEGLNAEDILPPPEEQSDSDNEEDAQNSAP
jgi:parvulin-like peptidyl-prolyl isomerase